MNLIENLNWRYATKRYSDAKVPQEKVERILEAIRLSASSMGLQPYSVIVIDSKNEALRKKLSPAANNQPQILQASHLLIFAAWENVTEEKVNDYMANIAATRNIPVEAIEGFKNMIIGFTKRSAEENFSWAARQAYIALGTGLIAAATENVDATPMEGFNPAAVDEVLGLKEKGLKSVLIMPIGYRDEANDPIVKLKKVRRSSEKFFINL